MNYFGGLLIITSFILMFVAVSDFYVGFNNTDMVFNYQNIAAQLNPYLIKQNVTLNTIYESMDTMINNKPRYLVDIYQLGVNQSVRGFMLMFASGVLLSLGIFNIYSKRK